MIRRCPMLLISTLVVTAILLRAGVGAGQITLDGSLRPGIPSGPLTGPGFVIPADVGEVRRNNLIHSIGRLDIRPAPVLEIPTYTMKGH